MSLCRNNYLKMYYNRSDSSIHYKSCL